MILCRVKGLDVEEIAPSPDGANGYGSSENPMGKIPILIRSGETALYDSPVICEYLDSVSAPWLAASGEARWNALRLHRIGDGLSEAVYNYRYETVRDKTLHWDAMIERHDTAIRTVVTALEREVPNLSTSWDFATLSIICGLDYAGYRAGHIDWRDHAPDLAEWHSSFMQDPVWVATFAYNIN